jgi:hypothetical protein
MQGTIGIAPANVAASTATPEFRIGTLGRLDDDTYGTRYFLYVHAAEAITGAGYAVIVDSAFEAEMVDSTSTAPGAGAGNRCGVAMAAVADNEYFWIQVYGKGSVRTAASAAVGTALYCTATAGQLDDAATAGLEHIVGVTLGTATGGAAATNSDAYFNFPYVGATA